MSGRNKYWVGIDLGTTHTVVAYREITQVACNSPIELLSIPQWIGLGEIAEVQGAIAAVLDS